MKKTLVLIFLMALFSASVIQAQTQNNLLFDGTDDTLNVPTSTALDGGTKFTLEAWIKTSAAVASPTIAYGIICKRTTAGTNGYSLLVIPCGGTDRICFKIGSEGNTFLLTTAIIPNRWYHIAAVFDG